MLSAFLIVSISSALFFYWFRYTVILILATRTDSDYADQVAADNRLSFTKVRQELQELHASIKAADLGGWREALERDYARLKYLLGYAAMGESGRYTAEQRLLMADFQVMAWSSRVIMRFRPESVSLALLEMISILEYFADVMGRRMASPASVNVRA